MRLADYSSEDHFFEFDPKTGAYAHTKQPSPRNNAAGYSGIGQLLRSFGTGRVLVAKYLLSGEPWFSIGAEQWRLFDESLELKHREVLGGFICEFSVHQNGTCIRTLRYLRRDWFLAFIDPTYDYLDFNLAHLPVDIEQLASLRQREEFIKIWSANAASTDALDPKASTVDTQPAGSFVPSQETSGIRKLANAFIPDATISATFPFLDARSVLERFKRKHGGLWVGGTVFVSERVISFVPNRLNRAVHEDLARIEIPSGDIREIKREFGWVTGIVVIKHANGEFRFRCYGAKRFAAAMAACLYLGEP